MPTKTFKVKSSLQVVLLLWIALVCLVFVFFATKWFLGNSISSGAFQYEVADFAISLAPQDPKTHFAKGLLLEKSFEPKDSQNSLEEYEKAVSLSPNDYRLWLTVGKAKERNGDSLGAEKALLKALELAPNYAEVHWVYGNILLRQNKTNEAFVAIRKAAESDPKFANPAATTAWGIFEGDIDKIIETVGDSPLVKSAVAGNLAEQKRFSESLEIWNNLPENDKKTVFANDGKRILNKLIVEHKYRTALPLKVLYAEDSSKEIAVGKIANGGFEDGINVEKQEIFEWQIASGNKPIVGQNTEQKTNGEKSLFILFNSPVGKDFRTVSQIVASNGDESYNFEVFYKSDLKTKSSVEWEIVDLASGKVLASTTSIEAKSDWASLNVAFRTPENCEGILIRLVRSKCSSADCSISGKVWFDDISLM